MLEVLLIVLGQVCESFTYVFETRIDTDLQLFRKEISYLLIRRSISLNLHICDVPRENDDTNDER